MRLMPLRAAEAGSHDTEARGEWGEADAGHQWTVYKRFSDFDKLRKSMVQAARAADGAGGRMQGARGAGAAAAAASIGALPPKRWRSMTPRVVQERMVGLQAFLSHATQQTQDPAVAEMLARFLMTRSSS
jgi:hypothetical protein